MIACVVFFFKQKTAYEMRISDWSSDVCSSDLIGVDAGDIATLDCDAGHPPGLHVVEELRIGDVRARAPAHIALKEVEQSKQQQDDDDPERCVPAEIHGEYSLQASGQASRRQGAGRPRPFGQPHLAARPMKIISRVI